MNTFSNLITILCLAIPSLSLAVINSAGERTHLFSRENTDNNVPGSGSSNSTTTRNSAMVRNVTCSDDEKTNSIPLKLMNMLSETGEGLKIESNIHDGTENQKKVRVEMPPYLSVCTNLVPQVKVLDDTTVVVSILNQYDFHEEVFKDVINANPPRRIRNADGNEVSLTPSYYSSMSTNDKYEACLQLKGVLTVDETGNSSLHRPNSITGNYKNRETFEFNIRHDVLQPTRVLYGSPEFLGARYGAAYGWNSGDHRNLACFKTEEIAQGGVALWTRDDIRRERILHLCREGSVAELTRAERSLGNAPELQNIISRALTKQRAKEAEEIYEKLRELRDDIKRVAEDEEQDLREDLEPLVRKYMSKIRNLKNNFISPWIEELRQLMTQREDASEEEREEIDKKIRELNELIGEYGNHADQYDIELMRNIFASNSYGPEAEELQEFASTSLRFSAVYAEREDHGRERRVSFSRAERMVKSDVKKFKPIKEEMEKKYRITQRGARYSNQSREYVSNQTRLRDQQWSRDMERIQDQMSSCQRTFFGFMKNPVRCKRAMGSRDTWMRQALSKRERYNQRIGSGMAAYSRYSQWESEYARSVASGGGGGGNGYDPFSTSTDLYSSLGVFGAGGGAGSMYTMGGAYGGAIPGQYGAMMGGGNPYASANMGGGFGAMGGGYNPMMMGGGYNPMMMGGMPQMNPYGGQMMFR